MRYILTIIAYTLLFFTVSSCDRYKSVYEHTDYFIDKLSTTYSSYGLQGANEKRYTDDGRYGVFPIGRLINVRIEDYATSEEYEHLRKKLEAHYKGDSRVNDVYINQAGTIMIDCRN